MIKRIVIPDNEERELVLERWGEENSVILLRINEVAENGNEEVVAFYVDLGELKEALKQV